MRFKLIPRRFVALGVFYDACAMASMLLCAAID